MSVVAGRNGIMAYEQLYEQNEKLILKTQELQNTCDQLKLDYAELQSDQARIEAQARKLGFIHDGEMAITIHGIEEKEPEMYDTGTVIRLSEITFVSERTCKIMGLGFFAVSALLMLALDLRKKRKLIIQEPEYEAQQI
ncbi:MAG: septum formation initiator family protein [Treponema sp.]|nr:septum formation initiator family protein [Candidatus Treponema caballi]